jgi:hypothetical protein
MLKNIMTQNAQKAKELLTADIVSQKIYIEQKEQTFYNSLIANPTQFSIRAQATFLASCRATLVELENTLLTLQEEFPSSPYDDGLAEDSANWDDHNH